MISVLNKKRKIVTLIFSRMVQPSWTGVIRPDLNRLSRAVRDHNALTAGGRQRDE